MRVKVVLSYNFMIFLFDKEDYYLNLYLQFIFSTAIDGKIKAWLYDCMGSRVDYDAPGLWCTTMAYSADGTRLVQKPVQFDPCLVSDLICFKQVRKLLLFLCNACNLASSISSIRSYPCDAMFGNTFYFSIVMPS